MNNLWIYGCSFSEPFGLQSNKVFTTDNDGTRNYQDVDFWGTHLSKKLHLKCISKAVAGVGWNYINYRIDEDIIKWSTDDIIIISPSMFARLNLLEFKNDNSTEHIIPNTFNFYTDCKYCVDYLKTPHEIVKFNQRRWKTKIKTLQKFGFKVYTWLIDTCEEINDIKNIILQPSGNYNWKNWIDNNPDYWLVANKDWHFNSKGHKELSTLMYEFIIKNEQY